MAGVRENDGKVYQPVSPNKSHQRSLEFLAPILDSLPCGKTEDVVVNIRRQSRSIVNFAYANVTVSNTSGLIQKPVIHPTGPSTPPQWNGTPGILGGYTVVLRE